MTASAETANASTMKSVPLLVAKSNSASLIVGISKRFRWARTWNLGWGVDQAIGNESVIYVCSLEWIAGILIQLGCQTEETLGRPRASRGRWEHRTHVQMVAARCGPGIARPQMFPSF